MLKNYLEDAPNAQECRRNMSVTRREIKDINRDPSGTSRDKKDNFRDEIHT